MLQNLERQSYYLGDLVGVPIFVHFTAIAMLFIGWSRAEDVAVLFHIAQMQAFIETVIVVVLGILLHELGHGLTGRALGAVGTTITLWAFGGLCRSRRDNSHAVREIAIVAAGPAVSLALWLGSELALRLLDTHAPGTLRDGDGTSLLCQFLIISMWWNRMLLLFNILPIYPLDGGQLVYNTMRLLCGDRLIVRQVCLTLAVVGAAAFFCEMTGLFGLLGQPDPIAAWWRLILDNLGAVAFNILILGFLLRNAFLHLG